MDKHTVASMFFGCLMVLCFTVFWGIAIAALLDPELSHTAVVVMVASRLGGIFNNRAYNEAERMRGCE